MSFIQSQPVAWLMWFTVAFFYAYQYVLRVLPSIIMPMLEQHFGIDSAAFGQFSGLYYLGYAGLHIPVGYYLDRFGVKRVLPVCILLTTAGLLPLWLATDWTYPMVGRFLVGLGSSAAILGIFKVVRLAFPPDRFTRMLGYAVTIGLLGAIYGGRPIHYLVTTFGWEAVLQSLALFGAGLAVITYMLLPGDKVELSSHTLIRDLKIILWHPKVLAVCILGGLMVGPLEGFADVWGSAFLREVYGLSADTAAGLPSYIFLGMCLGASVLSDYAERKQAYYPVIIVCALGMSLGFLWMLLGFGTTASLSVVFFLIGTLCAYQILVIFKAGTYLSEGLVGLTTAVANTIIMAFGYLFHTLIGYLMVWCQTMETTLRYMVALGVIPFGLSIGFVGFSIIYRGEVKKPAFPKKTLAF